jgi:ketosteroid isomerase-like protein
MRAAFLIALAFLWSMPLLAQDTDSKLESELVTLHTQWFKAFDAGDGPAMNQMEVNNLVLVMPIGVIYRKTTPRGKHSAANPPVERTLSDVSVRRYEGTAILTGALTSKSSKENSKEATTVVFVMSDGKWKVAAAQWTPVSDDSSSH